MWEDEGDIFPKERNSLIEKEEKERKKRSKKKKDDGRRKETFTSIVFTHQQILHPVTHFPSCSFFLFLTHSEEKTKKEG